MMLRGGLRVAFGHFQGILIQSQREATSERASRKTVLGRAHERPKWPLPHSPNNKLPVTPSSRQLPFTCPPYSCPLTHHSRRG